MRLIIAEKPSLGKDIAQALGGATAKGSGYVECGTDVVTWCFGHMFEEAEPDVYLPDDVPKLANGKKQWRVEDLPIIPAEWQLNIRGGDEGDDGVERQVKTIGKNAMHTAGMRTQRVSVSIDGEGNAVCQLLAIDSHTGQVDVDDISFSR